MGQGNDGRRRGDAKIAMLDLGISQPFGRRAARSGAFLQGFGIELGDPAKWGDETDPRIVGHEVTAGNEEGGLKAMETLLAQGSRDQHGLHDQRTLGRRRL